MFKVSPISILRSPRHEWLMYLAAQNVILEDKRREAEQMKAKSRK